MKIINALIAYFLYFVSPKTLMRRSFIGTLLHFNIRLPNKASEEIIDYLYDIYHKNKKIDKIMNRGGMNANMERMLNLIQYEAFFIKDYFSNQYTLTSGHEKVVSILEKYQISQDDKRKAVNSKILYFKDNEGAFEVAGTMHSPVLSKNSMCVGIVRYIDPRNHGVLIDLAGADEPLHVMGFNDKHVNLITPGDLVYWGFVDHSDMNSLNIKAVGHVLAILKPEFDPHTKKWGVKKDLTK